MCQRTAWDVLAVHGWDEPTRVDGAQVLLILHDFTTKDNIGIPFLGYHF